MDPNLKMGQFMAIKISYKSASKIGISINGGEEHFAIQERNFEVTSKYTVNNIILNLIYSF
jgi:hypothetical protein